MPECRRRLTQIPAGAKACNAEARLLWNLGLAKSAQVCMEAETRSQGSGSIGMSRHLDQLFMSTLRDTAAVRRALIKGNQYQVPPTNLRSSAPICGKKCIFNASYELRRS